MYIKDGIMILGNKPMFDDVQDELLGQAIKAKIFEVFGFYPILDISENWTIGDEDDEPVVLRDFELLLDTELVDKISGYELSYVQFLFERLIQDRVRYPERDHTNTNASKKYCFSDTEDWWDAAKVEELAPGRKRHSLSVVLG